MKQFSSAVQSYLTLQPHGLQPTRLLLPWDSPGKNTGVGCHFLLQGIFPTQGLNPGIQPGSPALEADVLTSEPLSHLCPTLCNPMAIARQTPPSMEFSRQEYWSGLPFPSSGDLPNPRIEPGSPALQADSLPSEPPGNLKQR